MTSSTVPISIHTHEWHWQGFPIRYQTAGSIGTPILLIHGFGASSDHWRKNLPDLADHHRVYALDLIGFGLSAKPKPNDPIPYTFETWGAQVIAFCQEVIGAPTFLVGNSIGCIVALQAAVDSPDWIQGVMLLNCSLRLLHERKRLELPWYQKAFTPLVQAILANHTIGHFFFAQIARPQAVRNALNQAYGRKEAVTDELVNLILEPARDVGAADVFLAFVRYSQGPLAEDLLPRVTCPVLIAWGEADPWEPITLGRELSAYSCVERFVSLSGVGHCPQDEAPELVNPLIRNWLQEKTLHHGLTQGFRNS